MMFLARVQPGADPQVYELTGALFFVPRSWVFVSYRRGASAIGHTKAEAVQAARRRLEQPRTIEAVAG